MSPILAHFPTVKRCLIHKEDNFYREERFLDDKKRLLCIKCFELTEDQSKLYLQSRCDYNKNGTSVVTYYKESGEVWHTESYKNE
jgi:hypothetical protein